MKNYFLLLFVILFSVSKSQNVNVVHRSNFQYPGKECANICGYVDSTGKEYALVGVETGMSIVDVTDPDNPFEVIALPWVAGPNQIWKEIKVLGHYAYVTSEAGGGLQIADLRHLPAANVPYHYWTPNLPGGTLSTITIDSTNYLINGLPLTGGTLTGELIIDHQDGIRINDTDSYPTGGLDYTIKSTGQNLEFRTVSSITNYEDVLAMKLYSGPFYDDGYYDYKSSGKEAYEAHKCSKIL